MDWVAAWSQWTTMKLYISPQNLVFFHHLLVFFHNPSSKSMPFWPNNISEGGMLIMYKFADCIKQNLNIEGKCLLLLCNTFYIFIIRFLLQNGIWGEFLSSMNNEPLWGNIHLHIKVIVHHIIQADHKVLNWGNLKKHPNFVLNFRVGRFK